MVNKQGRPVLIDFGFAHKYTDKLGFHSLLEKTHRFKGTWAFCSLRTARKQVQSRRDDLESLLYLLMYLMDVELPWTQQHLTVQERKLLMREKKSKSSYSDLYAYVPHPYHKYLRHIEDLSFEERPDYDMLRGVLQARLRFEEEACKPRRSSGSDAHVDSETTLHDPHGLPSTMMRGLDTTSFGSKAKF